MRRIIDRVLIAWKNSSRRKPLILRGARQVGKTYSLTRFGEEQFESVVRVDLERNSDWHRVFNGDLNPRRITADLEILLGMKITPGKTLLFIDEIQACPRAITALCYFHEELPELHVVAAGSLLEFAMEEISFPVGRVQFTHLYPLTFAEYLLGIGNEEAARKVLDLTYNVSETVHAFLCRELRRYFFIGGFPECVAAYVKSGSMRDSFEVQAEIVETYRMDFAKYAPRADKQCLNAVLSSVAQNVGQQIKYSRLSPDFSQPTLKKAFNLLCLAGLIKKIPSTDPSGLPLGATASDKKFKAVMADIGLIRYLTGMPVEIEHNKADLLDIYRGGLAEQFVGQEMIISQNNNIYYWARQAKSSTAEIDYLAVIDGRIHPVEVKSGAAGRLKSLHFFLRKYHNVPEGIVFSMRPYAELPEQKLVFIPLYFAFSATGGIAEL